MIDRLVAKVGDRQVKPAVDRALAWDGNVLNVFPAGDYPAYGFFGKIHPVAEYNDYTQTHLPMLERNPELPRIVDAILAILAARIAFSSFAIRS